MLLVIITVREEAFPEIYCWALQECTVLARQAAGWSAEPLAQKVVRLPPAEFCYYPGAGSAGSAAEVPSFVLVEVMLPQPKPTAEKEAFWAEFHAGVEARLCSMEVDVVLRFVEMPGQNVYFNRKEPSL